VAKVIETLGRESGTGQDTPLGVCPCPAPLLAAPRRTWCDIVPSCPAVPLWGAKLAPGLLAGTPMVPTAFFAFDVSNEHQEAV
jgi:hypothetical protein